MFCKYLEQSKFVLDAERCIFVICIKLICDYCALNRNNFFILISMKLLLISAVFQLVVKKICFKLETL